MKKFIIIVFFSLFAVAGVVSFAACAGLHEHSFSEWTVTIPATCTATGEEQRACSCGKKETHTISALGHTEVIDAAIMPTCTETGLTEGKHCSSCNEVIVEQKIVPARGHYWNEGEITRPAYCTQAGMMVYTCGRCGETKMEKIEAKGHIEVIDDAVAPTCTEMGLTVGKHCLVCDEVLVKQKILPIIPHNYEDGVCTMCGKRDENYVDERLVFTLSDDGTYYSVDYRRSDHYPDSAQEVYIPSVYQGLPVASIESGAFYSCTMLIRVMIPDSIISIGDQAFRGCYNLQSITIPDSVTSIGNAVFSGCESLASISVAAGNPAYQSAGNCLIETESKTLIAGCKNSVIPADGSVTSISDFAFAGRRLTDIVIPDSIVFIGVGVFSDCDELACMTISEGNSVYHSEGDCLIETERKILVAGCKNSVIPDDGSVASIGDYAFSCCEDLTSILIPHSVASIGKRAFLGCKNLMCINIPNSVASIGEKAFFGCKNLTSINIPDGVTSIENGAFSNCENLTCINIPESVVAIGDYAFSNCIGLTSVMIPNSVISIGSGVFSNCDGVCEVENGVTYVDGWAVGCDKNTANISLRSNTRGIADSAFFCCESLTSINIPDSVTSIGSLAFYGCESLTSVTIPGSVTSIGKRAFEDCYSLTSVMIGDGVTSIGDSAFFCCESLTSINIPDSVTSIGSFAFYNCDSLANVTFENPNGWSADGEAFAATILSNPATAARYLNTHYNHHDWIRNNAKINKKQAFLRMAESLFLIRFRKSQNRIFGKAHPN